ncbi:hypothetical protein Tsubulata_046560 [Turnera subulata]|uniref:RBR-type E3 ubiquitin transferase n=1 Tax=Turnera subulata TaxID=218843 RepID=A0A9Q0G4M7_9ROSI|nr:hypothetical protein Tsubulata_046560 [Turnera subulata]
MESDAIRLFTVRRKEDTLKQALQITLRRKRSALVRRELEEEKMRVMPNLKKRKLDTPKPAGHNMTILPNPEKEAETTQIIHLDGDDDDDDDGAGAGGSLSAKLGFTKENPILVDDVQYTFFDDDDDDVHILNFRPQNITFGKRPSGNNSMISTSVCEICAETRTSNEFFSIKGCSHAYCTHCVAQYIESRLQENIIKIRCPVSDCKKGWLDPVNCREILPGEVFDRWGNALCEAAVPRSKKFYCPYKDCSAMLIKEGRRVSKECECPNCKRSFCVKCKVAWHSGMKCDAFQKLNEEQDENERGMEDIMLAKLAGDKRWKRCPVCRVYVEKTEGCNHMKCRCKTSFCYRCGCALKSGRCPKCEVPT